MKDQIQLVFPTLDLKEQALDYKKEFFAFQEPIICGSALLDQIDDYEEWLKSIEENTDPKTLKEGWVLSDVFFAIRQSDQRMIGIINLRYGLNDFLKNFGHCGYSVRPSERQKGYASEMLKQACLIAQEHGLDHLQLSADQNNIASIKTILKNGGQYQWSFPYEESKSEGRIGNVYFIDLEK